ncbi:MAG: TRAP transporter small permease [Chloroflexi bacterium]|nr:TRAP transporter small permease [Chloroflexota bacterium]
MNSTNIKRVIDGFQKANRWLMALPMAALVGMLVLDSVNVTTIRLFKFVAIRGQKDLIEELLVVAIFVPLAYVLLGPGHIKTDMVVNALKARLRFAATMISDIAILSIALFCTWTSVFGGLAVFARGTTKQGDLQLPLTPGYTAISLAFILLVIAAVLHLVYHIALYRDKKLVLETAEKPSLRETLS